MNTLAADIKPNAGRTQRYAMPAWIYSHPAMAALEHERILRPSWQIVCHQNSIPKAGDFVTFEIGPDSVVVVRDKDGSIRASRARNYGTSGSISASASRASLNRLQALQWTRTHRGGSFQNGVALGSPHPGTREH